MSIYIIGQKKELPERKKGENKSKIDWSLFIYCSLSVYDVNELRLLAPEEAKRGSQRSKSILPLLAYCFLEDMNTTDKWKYSFMPWSCKNTTPVLCVAVMCNFNFLGHDPYLSNYNDSEHAEFMVSVEQVDILISKNQVLQILYLKHHT